ncbi:MULTISPECIES: SOS response-associated peptidase [unclassified Ruegeria]|uniref:SOS response-associated peptidase n=1 Tax=unclassified Ruegeria TaxID=2625375 RepID=UPI0014909BF5|nr:MULTISPECIES: SOS response-associated peptidase [unclassified Ruegeria]NOD48713.1 SOS response-associated peptidase [Ruegeria sp. HKCCD5849]NOD51985.1 SOS response-associated peptidase [Ruegeria sp. HKCCD5851]NOD66643.1 SOS response-associated peptidase [Ruegeria sp. HKCCD7303]
MCNLYSNTIPADAMRQLFDVAVERDRLGNAEPLPAIFPKQKAPVVRKAEDGERELVSLSWGFRTTKKSKKTGAIIQPNAWNNARDDKVRINGLWKGSFEHRRCLVPASSFCEAKGRNPATYYWFALTGDEDRPPFAFAGMWQESRYEGKEGTESVEAYTVITTTANEIVKPIHPQRMPVILEPEDYEQWINGSADDAFELLKPFDSEQMRIVQEGELKKSDPAGR